MTFAVHVGIGVFARDSAGVGQDEVTDMDMRVPVVAAVDFVDFVELASLAVAAHTTVALANWSHSPGETSARRLQRGMP